MKWVALVAIRAGSKRFPKKNLASLHGKPLYAHSVDQALQAGADTVFITTDIEEVLTADLGPRVKVLQRPRTLAGDDVGIEDVILDVIIAQNFHDHQICLLQATSPIRLTRDIHACLNLHSEARDLSCSMVMSVTQVEDSILKYGLIENDRFVAVRSNRDCFQNAQLLPTAYKPNGSIYVFSGHAFKTQGGFPAENIIPYIMDARRSVDIDHPEDLALVKRILDEYPPISESE